MLSHSLNAKETVTAIVIANLAWSVINVMEERLSKVVQGVLMNAQIFVAFHKHLSRYLGKHV